LATTPAQATMGTLLWWSTCSMACKSGPSTVISTPRRCTAGTSGKPSDAGKSWDTWEPRTKTAAGLRMCTSSYRLCRRLPTTCLAWCRGKTSTGLSIFSPTRCWCWGPYTTTKVAHTACPPYKVEGRTNLPTAHPELRQPRGACESSDKRPGMHGRRAATAQCRRPVGRRSSSSSRKRRRGRRRGRDFTCYQKRTRRLQTNEGRPKRIACPSPRVDKVRSPASPMPAFLPSACAGE